MVNDTISDMLTRIRNANMAKNDLVLIPFTHINLEICQILLKEGFIQSFKTLTLDVSKYSKLNAQKNLNIVVKLKYLGRQKNSCITNLLRISKPGNRIYAKHKIPDMLGGLGIIIVSTSAGIMTDREAREQKIGGELLCSVW
uniref:Small ribosomal subunit protein uS8c n=1 Tax=Pleurastrum terricola TaxID=34116 RepID=RR8_PLETE|nr:ribosomal protein S8 [Pleurastrum terricola]A6YGD0.1 RecName: Full=Small ribosomal subunit protein uS8c; AltName: Full=30S ribosomal protein S8, chloroplastic [Pleurastrum terricola]ABO69343.1 ribosomal protein S8 [Pleurastrum terricola]